MQKYVKVRMKADHDGSNDGIQIKHYAAGQEYEVSQSLAEVFLGYGYAEAVEEKAEPEPSHQPAPPEVSGSGEEKAERHNRRRS